MTPLAAFLLLSSVALPVLGVRTVLDDKELLDSHTALRHRTWRDVQEMLQNSTAGDQSELGHSTLFGMQFTSVRSAVVGTRASASSAGPEIVPKFDAPFKASSGHTGRMAYDLETGGFEFHSDGNASYIRADVKDRFMMRANFKTGEAVSGYHAVCHAGLMKTRGEVLFRLLVRLSEATESTLESAAHGREINGSHCDYWNVTEPGLGTLFVCVRKDGAILHLYAAADASYVGASNTVPGVAIFDLYFHDISFSPTAFAAVACEEDMSKCPTTCPDQGVVNLQVFRGSNGEPWGDLFNRDTGDLAGDIISFLHPHDGKPPKKYMAAFSVTASSAWGPFRDCNYFKGQGLVCEPPRNPSLSKQVTRMSAEVYAGPCVGMCGKNEVVGSWYTFPKEGQCKEGQEVGHDGCTWRLDALKVVSLPCAYSEGNAVQAWTESFGDAPWPKMQAALRKGLESCPDIRDMEAAE